MTTRLLKLNRNKTAGLSPLPLPADRLGTREVRLSALERQFLPEALAIEATPPSPLPGAVLWTIAAMMTSFLVWASLSHTDVIATVQGKVIPDGKVKTLQSKENAIVSAIHVKEGQYVKSGELLVELDNTFNTLDLGTRTENLLAAKLELTRLTAQLAGRRADYAASGAPSDKIASQQALQAAEESNYNAMVSESRSQAQASKMALLASQAALRNSQEALQSARDKEARVRPYIGHVMSQFEYQKLKDSLAQLENEVAGQNNIVRQAAATATAAEQRIFQVEQRYRSQLLGQIQDKTTSISMLSNDMGKSQKLLSQQELRAPVSGYVQSLKIATVGGVVLAAQTIATIVPKDTPMIIDAQLSNEDVGFVKLGQRVDIKVGTFPFQKYGSIPGRVTWISPDVDESDGKSLYRMRIKPDVIALNVNGVKRPISPGMTVQGAVVLRQRRIIDLFVDPILKNLDGGLGSR